IEPGGIRSSTAVDFLARLIDTHDHCNRTVTLASNGGGSRFWPTGRSVDLTWTATDPGPRDASGLGNSVELTQHVEVRDSYPPVLLAPPSQVRELPPGQENGQVQIDLGAPRVFDLANLEPVVGNDATGDVFGIGLTEVHWTASDGVNTSEAVQLINVKANGTNTPPVAHAQSVSASSFEDTEILLSGSDADFHPTVNRYDPLTFSIVDGPDHGRFVAPLLPYFIDDYRLEASALKFDGDPKQEDPAQYCQTRGGSDPVAWQIAYPYDPEWMAVGDDGTTMVYDRGSARCDNNNALTTSPRLVIFDASHDLGASREISAGGVPTDIFWDRATNRIYVARVDSQDDDFVYVYGPDLTQIARYNLGTGFSEDWQLDRPVAVTVDGRGILYVANTSRVNAYRQVDGVPDIEGSSVFLGTAWVRADTREIQSLATDSSGHLYIGEPDRILKLTPAELGGGAVFVPGTLVGWLGYCSSNLTGEYACDTPSQRSVGFACTDALCGPGGVQYGSAPGQFKEAKGIAVDPHDVLYVSDYGNSRVQRFTSDGTFGGEAKSAGAGYGFLLGDFGRPQDIEVNSDHFYILNRDAKLLHIFATTPLTPVDDQHAKVTYRSDNNFVGMDAFRFAVTDGFDSAEADVTLEVSRNFRPPEVPDSGLAYAAPATQEDQAVTFTVPATDPDGGLDTLTLQIVRAPAHGTIAANGLDVTYTPDANYSGPDDFAYRVYDGRDTSAQTGEASVEVDPVEDAPTIAADAERTASLGFKLAHRVDVFDPDEDEQLLVTIDWGDGTRTDEGHFELDGMPIPAEDARNDDGTIRDDVKTTGPMLSVDPTGRGVLMADHVYTTAGTYQLSSCVYDKVQLDTATQVKSLTGASKQACAATAVTVGSAAELVLDAAAPDEAEAPGAAVEIAVTLRNLAFDLDAADPRFSQLPAQGSDIVGLELDGEVADGLELSGVDAPGGVCTTSGAELHCTFAALLYDSEQALTVRARVADTAAGRAVLGLSLEGRWLDMPQAASGGATFEVASSGAAPELTEISPTTGDPSGFTKVTLTGSRFEAGSAVLFGGRPGTQVQTIDSRTMTVLAPAASIGTVDVTVVNPDDQQATLSGAWTYAAAAPPEPTPPGPGPNPTPPGGGSGGASGDGGGGGGTGALDLLLLAAGLLRAARCAAFAMRDVRGRRSARRQTRNGATHGRRASTSARHSGVREYPLARIVGGT
ncbi:MAG TPA: Ig-like domain-containing protein, partial [Gammaproteobacteria bacterium]|nr:Ig-like domain-containing protein [Gammaproteobacteria bacterium]